MSNIKKMIPLCLKTTIATFLSEIGRWPIGIVFSHMRRSFAENGGCGAKGKDRAWRAAHIATLSYLKKCYGHLVENVEPSLGQPTENAPVWVFWWQGEENAPVLVQRCIASIRKYAGNHPVRVIDQENYREFVTIPAHIEVKREQGIISLTHFSD